MIEISNRLVIMQAEAYLHISYSPGFTVLAGLYVIRFVIDTSVNDIGG